MHYRLSLEAGQKKERDRIQNLKKEIIEVVQRLQALRLTREKRVTQELQTDSLRITVQHPSKGRL